ncbi:hypothetical protein V8F33_007819 [Rhypophila sp. PSN 637]
MLHLWNQAEFIPLTSKMAQDLQAPPSRPDYPCIHSPDMGKESSTTSKWPETPFTLIRTVYPTNEPSEISPDAKTIHVARLMALTHNTILRALNAIYTQSALLPMDDSDPKAVKDLLTFTKFTIAFLQNHHKCEELVLFPMLEAQASRPGMMSVDVEQHKAFEDSLHDLEGFVKNGLESNGKTGMPEWEFGPQDLRFKIDALAQPLSQHLHEEIPRLLEVGKLVGGDILEICYTGLHDQAEGTTDAFEIGPLVLGCQDRTLKIDNQEIQFPVLPFSWAPYLVQHIVARKHAGAWRFCPSTFFGEPRDSEWFPLNVTTTSNEYGKNKRSSGRFALVLFVVVAALVFVGFGGKGPEFPVGNWFHGLFSLVGSK